eukprot:gene11743-13193_t
MLDPENTPPRTGSGYSSAYNAGSTMMDDPWFTAGQNSPTPATSTYNNAYPSSSYAQPPNQFPYMGVPANTFPPTGYGSEEVEDYENEPPLLEELGIRFDHIWSKTQAVINPTKAISEHILDDTDLAGPLVFCLLLGGFLLLSGKVSFGYIYGFSVCGCLGLQAVISLMHPLGLDFWRTCSVLGYCLLPVIFLSILSIGFKLTGSFGLILSLICIGWSTFSATRLFDAKLNLTEQYWLLAYPIMLLYSCFVLITIF